MNQRFFGSLIILLFVAFSCKQPDADTTNQQYIKKIVYTLADDTLRGREAGTPDEIKARDFLVHQMQELGLKPYFAGGQYYKAFRFKDGANYSSSSIELGGKSYLPDSDFHPFNKSRSGDVEGALLPVGFGIMSPSPAHNDYPNHSILDGKIFVMEMSVPGGAAHWDEYGETAQLDKRIELASKFGARAVILINSDSTLDDPRKTISNKPGRSSIPVIVAHQGLRKALLASKDSLMRIHLVIKKEEKTGYNVAAYLDNGSAKSILIGAHYDHLGMGGETSRYHGGPAIHNGADDNASGVAASLALIRRLKARKLKYNMILMNFSGEEKGLLGSSALIKQHDVDTKNLVCMLNFDMVGRMDSASDLTLFGTGTAAEWDSVMRLVHGDSSLQLKKVKTGIGGSDQMSFYLDSVPVLFFFTGFHDDYHTPSDDADKINYPGMEKVVDYAYQLVLNLQDIKHLRYIGNKAHRGGKHNYRQGPTLGIVPDYGSEGGMTIQAVLDGRPGAKAGLRKGDVLLELAGVKINDIYDYMDALKQCKKHEPASLKIKRGERKLSITVNF